MINRDFPTLYDYENLSRVNTVKSDFANNFDYSSVVVNKPWGYEYLWFENSNVAIWLLSLNKGSSTSLHCHPKKRTSLIVLEGTVKCKLLDSEEVISKGSAIVLEPCVFHQTYGLSDNVILIEVETPPMKGDLVRMKDKYGLERSSYELTNEYSTDFSEYFYQPMRNKNWNYLDLIIEKKTVISDLASGIIIPIGKEEDYFDFPFFEVGMSIYANDIKTNSSTILQSEFLNITL